MGLLATEHAPLPSQTRSVHEVSNPGQSAAVEQPLAPLEELELVTLEELLAPPVPAGEAPPAPPAVAELLAAPPAPSPEDEAPPPVPPLVDELELLALLLVPPDGGSMRGQPVSIKPLMSRLQGVSRSKMVWFIVRALLRPPRRRSPLLV
ncbi:Hypothetical protein A7982_01340 [Minicystis rosea]|nr:Hypothetical protein A7982_01340 [Minicystis rosea]